MAKRKAHEEEEKERRDGVDAKNVYFICMAGANPRGEPEKRRRVFDVITQQYEFNGISTSVKPYNVYKLMEEYHNSPAPQKSSPSVYDLVEEFIKNHQDANFFLDECPILKVKVGVLITSGKTHN